MNSFFTTRIRLFLFFFLICSLAPIAEAKLSVVNCSADQNKAKINEVNLGKNQFIEIYFTSSITTLNWDICYLNDKNKEVCSSNSIRVPANNSYSAGDFVVFSLPSKMHKDNGEILLKDGNGKIIDSFTYCKAKTCTNKRWSFDAACTTTFTNHAKGQDVLYRKTPDGTGVFTQTKKDTTKGKSNGNLNKPAPNSAVQTGCGIIPSSYPLYSGTEINIEKDITINNGTNTNIVSKGIIKPGAAISSDGTVSNNVSLTLPALDPGSFPANNSNNNLQVTTSSTITGTSFKKIEIASNNITVNFTGGGPFFIDELIIKSSNVTLNFAAGTYYINKFKVEKDNPTINTSTFPVIFHIGKEFKIDGKNANINTGGNVADFQVYLHSGGKKGAKFESKKENFNFTGLIYGPDKIDKVKIEGANSTFRGAVIVADGKLEIEKQNVSFIYTPADQTAIGNISTCAGGGGGGGGDTAASIFNCVESGADGISGKLYTKTTAQSFSFDIVALRDASTIETGFASGADHTITVELINAKTAASCDSYPPLSPAISQSLTMTTTDSGIKASAAMSSNTAYKAVKCRVTDATDSPSVIGCSTDSFAIRPTSFSITSSQTNSGSTGLPIAKAGENFTLTATATSGYTGTPVINNSNIEAHAGAIQTGTVSGLFNAAISGSGIATGTNFTYSEAGSLRFTAQGIYDNNFTTIDQLNDCTNDFSNTVDVNGKVGCKFGNTSASAYFGRFTPDHFVVSNKSLEDRNNLSCSSDSIFTYTGESFQTSFTLTAENSSNNTTQNYTGIFAKLGGSDLNFGAIDLTDAVAPISATALSSQLSIVSSSGSWASGIANMTAILGVNRTIPAGPFESFSLGIAPADSDGITISSFDLDTSVPPDSNDKELLATTKIRFGRLNIGNAHGSELLALPVPMQTEYYNGTSFIINTDDTCTPISVSQLSFNAGTSPVTVGSGTSTASIANSPLALGLAGLSLSAPGDTGFIDITSSIFISSFPWLNYDWDGDGSYDDSPSARATFGIYKGNSKQIYFREVY